MSSESTVTTPRHPYSAPGADYAATASEAYRAALRVIESVEPRIAAATRKELADQRDSLKLIASENYASPAVLLTMGSWLSDKYAEGTIGHRFYAGCQNVDEVEAVAAEHARELFGAPYAYAQPHSGIDANLVAFWAILATRVEAPALSELGVKHVNDLSEAEWERLRARLGSQRLLGQSREVVHGRIMTGRRVFNGVISQKIVAGFWRFSLFFRVSRIIRNDYNHGSVGSVLLWSGSL